MKLILPILLCVAALSASAGPRVFVRAGAGVQSASDLTFLDADCTSTSPPALFGCVDGNDGRPLAARAEGPRSPSFELGAGLDYGAVRAELVYSQAFDFSVSGEANFIGVEGEQPVHAEIASSVVLIRAVWEPVQRWKVRPFVGAGAGVSRNSVSAMVYSFPGIAADAVTIVPGDRSSHFAWSAVTGVSVSVGAHTDVEIGASWIDAGSIETAAREAVIVRPRGVFRITVAGTESALETVAFSIAVRRRF